MKWIVNPFSGQLEALAVEPWKCFNDSLGTGEVKAVDIIPSSGTHALTYIVAVYAGTASKRVDIDVIHDGGTIKYKVRRLGNSLNFSVDAKINGSNIELELTNLEAFSIDVEVARLKQ